MVFEKLLTLATEARIESLPLNHLAQKMWISCEDEKPWAARKPERSREPYGLCNGGVMPVKDAVFLSGLCRVHLGVLDISCAERSASRTDRGNPWNSPRQIQLAQPPDDGDGASRQQAYERSRRRMILSGPQVVRIAVRRDGTADDGISTVVVSPLAQFDANGWAGGDRASDPLSEEQKAARRLAPIASLEMTLPPKAAEGEGPFRVRVAVGAVAPTPVYRDEMTPLTAAAVDSSNLFSAQLSPRGPFGFKGAPIRMFVTVPVQAMGVQLPANPRNLTSSQDSRYYEVSTLRTGVMVGLEPWDYTLRKSLFPVPFRVLAGFQFVSIDGRAARFDPRFEVAFKVTLPLIDSDKKLGSQFGTSVTLGPAFNIDLADGHPYFVFHLGFDVLTLFAAK